MNDRLSLTARLLGFAGLLPQLAFVGLQLVRPDPGWSLLAFAYAALILSFLGGIWWGVAAARRAPDAALIAVSVVPTLVAMAVLFAALHLLSLRWPLVLLGSAIMLTLLVDRSLTTRGDVPVDWMRLRVPLSLGLGALTILGAVL
ncbi:DUF3429 domain-containing protein [Sphingomonas rubra]|uniref:DUF3429 domain-containing protein n=1 Tax=Sphingomonas rubra TaxID=634430 RepID=A0A1I5R981_9SPHN|nr:DUF3429 domain-containing protein [Sphingomonas rubra]SFP54566.1 Protein of unknown function [Sphingomonas rubra]